MGVLMKRGEGHPASRLRAIVTVFLLYGCTVALGAIGDVLLVAPAQALPSFARQTGQPCGTCHTDFPALTPYGRRFKLLGYTTGGGKFRTTPFSSDDGTKSLTDYLKATDARANDESGKIWVPPISMMGILRLTHTE